MKRGMKTKWIKALMSGRYRQGKGALHEDGRYCCLGVLAQINGAKWVGGVPMIDGKQISAARTGVSFLRPAFCGISDAQQNTLANMNDGSPCYLPRDFKQIAAYIRKHVRVR